MDFGAILKSVIVDPILWLDSIWKQIGPDGLNLPASMKNLGIILLITGVVWSGIKIASNGAGMELKDFLIRLLIACALVFSSESIGDSLRSTWVSAYKWGRDTVAAKAIKDTVSSVTALAAASTAVGVVAAAAPGVLEAVKVGFGKNPIEAINDAKTEMAKSLEILGKIVQFILGALATLFGSYYLVSIMSGFTVLVAALLLPLSGAMVIFPGGAVNQWFGNWFKSVTGAMVMVMIMPIIFTAALNFGFIQPGKNFTDGFTAAANTAKSSLTDLQSIPGKLASGDFASAASSAFSGISGSISSIGQTITASTVGLVASVIMLIIGIIFSVVIIYAAQQQVMNFIGGTFSGGKEGGAAGQAAMGAVGGAVATAGGAVGSLAVSTGVAVADGFSGGAASKGLSVAREAGGGGGASSPGGSGSAIPSSGGGSSPFGGSGSATPGGGSSSGGGSKVETAKKAYNLYKQFKG
jgi:hypothetical protein